MLTQSSAGQNASLPAPDLELVNYGAGHAWFRAELDAAIRDADQVHESLTRLLDRRPEPQPAPEPEDPRFALTDLGRRVIAELEKLGVMVDLAHASDPLFWDALRAAKKPVLVSHSSSRALTNHPRNLTDAQLTAVARNGGAACVNFSRGFIDDAFRKAAIPVANRTRDLRTSERRKAFVAAGLPDVPVERLLDHVEHMVAVAGADHVCLGSDFDGVPMLPVGLEDVSKLPVITAGLLRRGMPRPDVEKILGLNVLRVLEANERR